MMNGSRSDQTMEPIQFSKKWLCRRVLNIALLVAASIGCTFPVMGQGTTSSLTGQVLDPTGAVIPHSKVIAKNNATNETFTQETSDSGSFLFAQLPPGTYTLTAEHEGFSNLVQSNVTLTVGQAGTLNFSLHVGQQGETVTVSSQAAIIDTNTAQISSVVDQHRITELPLNGRDPSSLVLLAPGATNVLAGPSGDIQNTNTFPTESGASAGGGRQGSTYYLLDGVPNIDTYVLLALPFPNSDATQEFRVITNNFEAQYGFSPGAVVTIQTRSGSNDLHGGLFEFIRNNDLNAGNYFTHTADTLKRNQFGGFIGGHIIPDKLFYFANYQGTIATTAPATNATFTPTAAMLAGDFSAVPQTLPAPFATVNGKPNQINPALFSRASVRISQDGLPLGQTPATGQVNFVGAPVRNGFQEGTGRLDYVINDKHRLFLRNYLNFFDQKAASLNGNLLAATFGQTGRIYNEVLGHTWVPSPTIVNNLTFSWLRNDFGGSGAVTDHGGNPICLKNYINVAEPAGTCYIEGLSVTNGFSGLYGEPNRQTRTSWWVSEVLNKQLGSHSLVVGGNAVKQYSAQLTNYPTQPLVHFGNGFTGFGLADFLLGDVQTFTQGAPSGSPVRGWQVGIFAQDQFKVKPNLTVNYGLRWEPNLSQTAILGGAAFHPGQQSTRYPNAPVGLVFPGDTGVTKYLISRTYGGFQPRVGIAWQPSFLKNTSLRAGFGMFQGPNQYSIFNHSASIAPFSPLYVLTGTTSNPISFDNPWANNAATGGKSPFTSTNLVQNPNVPASDAFFTTPITVGAVYSPGYKLGMTQSWTVSLEQQLTSSIALHLAYVGSQSYHQTILKDLNPGFYSAKGARVMYAPNFGQILQFTSEGTASYHALQAGFEKRLSYGFQFQSNFTWSKSMDIQSNAYYSNVVLSNPLDPKHDRGVAGVNVPLISISNLVYTSPDLHGHNGFVRNVLGAWEASLIYTMQSGFPFSIQGGNGNNNSGSLQLADRADLTGQSFLVHQGSKQQWLAHYFNTAAFTSNAPGTFGNSQRNLLKGPGISTGDLALIKNWAYRERYRLQLRGEFFNVLNHPSFGLPNTTTGASNFGQITAIGAIPPRVIQGGLKLTF
jgi:hypothetical protein